MDTGDHIAKTGTATILGTPFICDTNTAVSFVTSRITPTCVTKALSIHTISRRREQKTDIDLISRFHLGCQAGHRLQCIEAEPAEPHIAAAIHTSPILANGPRAISVSLASSGDLTAPRSRSRYVSKSGSAAIRVRRS